MTGESVDDRIFNVEIFFLSISPETLLEMNFSAWEKCLIHNFHTFHSRPGIQCLQGFMSNLLFPFPPLCVIIPLASKEEARVRIPVVTEASFPAGAYYDCFGKDM